MCGERFRKYVDSHQDSFIKFQTLMRAGESLARAVIQEEVEPKRFVPDAGAD
jgi:hypothetical protein